MKLYYSGATTLNTPQTDVNKSLGGFMSSSEVPNGRLNNIFNDISSVSRQYAYNEIKGIFLKNTTGSTVNNVLLYTVPKSELGFTMEVAAATAISGKMEQIIVSRDLPLYGDFHNTDSAYAKSLCTITGALAPSSNVVIEGRVVTVDTNNNNDLFIANAIAVFSTDTTLEIVKVSSTQFYIKYRNIGNFTTTPNLFSTGNVISRTAYSGGIDNSALVSNSMANNDILALWFKKTIIPKTTDTDDELYTEFKNNNYRPIQNLTTLNEVALNIQWS
jgi:hypothetical protein